MVEAIAYCRALGRDPDERVWGYCRDTKVRISKPRWQWYLGASPALAEGACNLSPRQIAKLREREA